MAMDMARMAWDDGILAMACTPHIMPPRYPNDSQIISAAVQRLTDVLRGADIALLLVIGADVRISFDLVDELRGGRIPCLHQSTYFLLEPDHKIATPHLDRFCTTIIQQGFRPVLTHPERLSWMIGRLDLLSRLHKSGVVMQITAGSITGRFGKEPQRLAEMMFEAGLVDVVASDAHNLSSRPPILSRARDVIEERYGRDLALRLTHDNPLAILLGNDIVRSQTDDMAIKGGYDSSTDLGRPE